MIDGAARSAADGIPAILDAAIAGHELRRTAQRGEPLYRPMWAYPNPEQAAQVSSRDRASIASDAEHTPTVRGWSARSRSRSRRRELALEARFVIYSNDPKLIRVGYAYATATIRLHDAELADQS